VKAGPQSAQVSVLCFGTTRMPVLEAMKWLDDEGGPAVNMLQIVTLSPFPADEVAAFLDAAAVPIVIEGNATGQLEGLIREQTLREIPHHLRRSDGRPISPELVYSTIKGLLGEPVELTDAGAVAPSKEDSHA
jgi:pyruvate/2-oxoacid:ferredoxin oxidoreductase alpha subunit